MKHDVGDKTFFDNNERYADLINGLLCNGQQILKKEDLIEQSGSVYVRIPDADSSRAGRGAGRREKMQDIVKKAALGLNFILIGLENQQTVDYSLPLRCMEYDAGQYEKQAAQIRRAVRKQPKDLRQGEYLYGFKKDSRLYPSIILILYYGEENWDGPLDLHGMLEFQDIPDEFCRLIQNYRIHLVEVRRLENTDVFTTDVKLVFDLIRYADDEEKLEKLVREEPRYQKMEWDAYEMAAMYTGIGEKLDMKCYDNGTVNICKGIIGLEEKARSAGKSEGKIEGQLLEQIRLITKKIQKNQSLEQIAEMLEKDPEDIRNLYDAVRSAGPDYNAEKIYRKLIKEKIYG